MQVDRQREYLLRALYAFKHNVVVVSPDCEILATTREAAREGGSRVLGKRCHQVYNGLSCPCENCPAMETMRTGKPVLREGQHCPQEEVISCLYAYPIFSGKTVEAVAVLDFDLPILGKLEESLHRSSAFLRNLILSSVDGVIASDKTGRILIFNDAASEILGYTIEEALHRLNIRDIYPGDGARDVMQKLRSEDYGGRGKLKSYQVDLLRKDGEAIPISLNAAIVCEGDREVATIGFFHDLRETLRMKEALEKTQLQLLQSEKMASLGKLAAGVAHQLNNPLGGITLFAKLALEEYQLEDGARQDLERILKDAQRCRDTVKELLEFARQTRQEMRPHDINRAISRTLFLLENQAIFQNIEIEKQLSPSLPPVQGDIQQLNHMFMNIILNAVEAMEGKGTLTLKTRLSPDGEGVIIEITDTGPGIPEEILPQIFEPFFTTKEEGKGTGLGLSLVYGIVENHGGRITARSRPGEGTTFVIELPLTRPDSGDSGDGE
ncbi:MAG: PAS domain S-box protein [Deltaproteobacteria bacterium]|nr:PAS domain S-box protein [Deltaproteobacteria bacterium]MBW2120445.1 PAS domain S-box protein [Deltaproteobacteria bacterium]